MSTRAILSVVFAAGLVVSAVGATAAMQPNSPPNAAATPNETAAPNATATPAAESTPTPASSSPVETTPMPADATVSRASGSAAASVSGSGTAATPPANYTRLYIDDRHRHLRIKPGTSETLTVTVQNGEDEAVTLSPRVVVPPRGRPPVERDWVSIETEETTVDAGESREFEVSVSVPEDAEIRSYGGQIAFTDETIHYPGRPARPVHSVTLHVEVWREPTVHVRSEEYIRHQVEAGDSFTREITVENTGDQAVPVNPQVNTERHHRPLPGPADRSTLDRSWLNIDAPTEIGAGETATIEVTVSPPADASRGDYSTEIDLGLKDPARSGDSSYWQQVGLHFQVWSQPEEPFETDFEVSETATDVVLELSTERRPRSTAADATFDVTFVGPNGTEVTPQRVQVTNDGHVNLGEPRRPDAGDGDGTYATVGGQRTVQYRLPEPDAGTWTAEIMPENAMQFGYEIVRTEG